MLRFLGFAALGLFVALVGSGLVYRTYAQKRTAERIAIHAPNGIVESRFVRLGGVEQWVQIRGDDRDNPVLLVLHGGPGMSYVPFTPLFRSWEKQFTVVLWDRRGVGATYRRNGRANTEPITFDRLANDGIELVEFLRQRMQKDKVILLGHSVGSIVGVLMAQRRPDLLYAYVGSDQIVDGASNERVSYDLLVERVRAGSDRRAGDALARLAAPPYTRVDDWFEKQKWISATDPVSARAENTLFKMAATAPGLTLRDLMAFGAGLKFSAAALLGEMMTIDLRARGLSFQTPVILIEGERDVLDPTQLAVDYFEALQAPTKELVIMKGRGHGAILAHPDEFLAELGPRARRLITE